MCSISKEQANTMLATKEGCKLLAKAGLYTILAEHQKWDVLYDAKQIDLLIKHEAWEELSKHGHDEDILIDRGLWKHCRTETLIIYERWKELEEKYPNHKCPKWLCMLLIKHAKWDYLARYEQWNYLLTYHQNDLVAQKKQWEILARYGRWQTLVKYQQWEILARYKRWRDLRDAGKLEYIPAEIR